MAYTLIADITEKGMNQGDLVRLLRNIIADINELKALNAASRTNVTALKDDGILGNPTLAIGSTPANVANVAFEYIINGNEYNKPAVAAGTAPGNDVVPQSLFGAVALDIDSAGTITATEATANATGYASAVLAIAGLPAVAANNARMGWVTATKSDGAFTFGTTALNAANTTVAYADAPSIIDNLTTPSALTNTSSLALTKG